MYCCTSSFVVFLLFYISSSSSFTSNAQEIAKDECIVKDQMNNVTYWINKLNLQRDATGAYASFQFMSPHNTDAPQPNYPDGTTRPFGTTLMTLFTHETNITFHKLPMDTVSTWIHGSTLRMYYFDGGVLKKEDLGIRTGKFMFTTRAGVWSTVTLKNKKPGKFAMTSGTMLPGLSLNDGVFATREELLAEFPNYKRIITKFTPEP